MAVYDPKKHCGGQRAKQPKGVKCTRPKGWGTDHPGVGRCKRHGGATTTHRRSAQAVIAQQECLKLGVPIEVDPGDALLMELWRTWGNISFYQRLVDELPVHPEPDLIEEGENGEKRVRGEQGLYGRMYHESGQPTGEARAHILLELLDRERKHAVQVAIGAARAGVEERRVKLEQQRGELIAELVRRVLESKELGLSDAKRRQGAIVAGRELRLIAGGAQ